MDGERERYPSPGPRRLQGRQVWCAGCVNHVPTTPKPSFRHLAVGCGLLALVAACSRDAETISANLFGGPGAGGKAMESAPTLGLDAFGQKLPICQDAGGTVHVTFNDLLALADRQQVSCEISLRGINRRLQETFSAVLAQ